MEEKSKEEFTPLTEQETKEAIEGLKELAGSMPKELQAELSEELKEEVPEPKELKKTEGGYEYIELDDVEEEGLSHKIRNSFSARRLTEDGETHEEYKVRRKMYKQMEKERSRGKYIWISKQFGQLPSTGLTYNKSKVEETIKNLNKEELTTK